MEGDLAKFPPNVIADENGFSVYQDFLGSLSGPQISNLAHSLLHNIASLRDNLKSWARKNGRDPQRIEQAFNNSEDLKLVTDLWDQEKHPGPRRDGGYSKKSPTLVDIRRILRLETLPEAGSFIGISLTAKGVSKIGSGTSPVIITGTIVDKNGGVLGDLYGVCLNAVMAWERELKQLGLTI